MTCILCRVRAVLERHDLYVCTYVFMQVRMYVRTYANSSLSELCDVRIMSCSCSVSCRVRAVYHVVFVQCIMSCSCSPPTPWSVCMYVFLYVSSYAYVHVCTPYGSLFRAFVTCILCRVRAIQEQHDLYVRTYVYT